MHTHLSELIPGAATWCSRSEKFAVSFLIFPTCLFFCPESVELNMMIAGDCLWSTRDDHDVSWQVKRFSSCFCIGQKPIKTLPNGFSASIHQQRKISFPSRCTKSNENFHALFMSHLRDIVSFITSVNGPREYKISQQLCWCPGSRTSHDSLATVLFSKLHALMTKLNGPWSLSR